MVWEYKVYKHEFEMYDVEKIQAVFNKFGEEGWELVNVVPQIASESNMSYGDVDININCCEEVYISRNICIFKRAKD